jgi:type IV secretory pathway VirB10-like protein
MRSTTKNSILPALVAVAALFAFACNPGEKVPGELPSDHGAMAETTAQIPLATVTPELNDLNNPPQSVEVQDDADLLTRERDLAARQADLDARERLVREREGETRAALRPTPLRSVEPRPENRPEEREVERDEPAPAREAEPAPARDVEPRDEPAREAEPEPRPEPRSERLPALVTYATVPAGTLVDVEFTEKVASNTHREGDTFRVRVTNDVREEGHVVIPAGSEILGQVTEAAPVQRKIGGRARLAVAFTDLVLPSGTRIPIEASFAQQGRSETGRDAATIGGAAAGGAILGRVLKKGNRSKGGTIGAIIGAAAGAVIASRTPGQEVVLEPGTVVSLRLDDPVEVRVASATTRGR